VRWRDAVGLAGRAVLRRPGRAVLTVTAVALAAALLTALLAIAATGRTRVLNQLSSGGPLAGIKVSAAEPGVDALDRDDPRPGPAKDLDDDARRRIAGLPGVATVSAVVAAPAFVVPAPPTSGPTSGAGAGAGAGGDPRPSGSVSGTAAAPATSGSASGAAAAPAASGSGSGAAGGAPAGPPPEPFRDTMVGVDLTHAGRLPLTVLAGRLPDARSMTEVAVTEGYLKRLGLDTDRAAAVVGTEVELGAPRFFTGASGGRVRGRWTRAAVVGVVAQEAAPGQLLVPLPVAAAAREWTAAGGDGDGRIDLPTSPYSGLFVVARGLGQVGAVRAAITRIGYSTSAPENLITTVLRYLRVVEIVLGAIGLIALLIAALGITNALLAAVRERRREIGVLKAIGARDRDVARTFLVEAGFLGLAGGLVGTAAGLAIAGTVAGVVNRYLVEQGLTGVGVDLPAGILAGAVAGSALLAMAAGVVPARRAARLPAREAMAEL
jgi:FtsX-like permease family